MTVRAKTITTQHAAAWAIVTTTYRGPTNSRGGRITARTDEGVRITMGYEHALSPSGNHEKAAELCLAKAVAANYRGNEARTPIRWTAYGRKNWRNARTFAFAADYTSINE